MKNLFLLLIVLGLTGCSTGPAVDFVLVNKGQNKMYLYKNSEIIKSYSISLGFNPKGHKMQAGDGRTPEGRYTLTYKNPQSDFYKSIRINYPNDQDIANAMVRGVDPGGDIVIHGLPNEIGDYRGPINPRNWTLGCIAVRNYEMDQLWRLIQSGTPIEITP